MIPKEQQQPFYFMPFILFGFAVVFLVSLLFTIKEDVFFSGDAGLKFLMVKQIAAGGSYSGLNLKAEPWVNEIWSQGFYPFKQPFVYEFYGANVIAFPPAFQWLNAWLFKWFGFKGIYVIPFLSIIALWFWFIIVMRRVGTRPLIISIAFFQLAFCSPLTVYGALYWEHGLAVLLLFSSIVFLLDKNISTLSAAVLGLLTGASVWLRPEMLLLCFLIIITVLLSKIKENKDAVFVVGIIASIALFFTFNWASYGNVFGAHSYQMLEPGVSENYFIEKFRSLLHLNGRLAIYFPLIALFIVLATYHFITRSKWPTLVTQLTLIIILFLLIVPFALPNAGGKQWGPRYLLAVIPMVVAAGCLFAKEHENAFIGKWVWTLLIAAGIYGFACNVVIGHQTLKNDFAYRVKPGMEFLRNNQQDVVVVQNQYIAQEFAALLDQKKFFLAEDQEHFDALMKLLRSHGTGTVLYLSHDAGFRRMGHNTPSNGAELKKIGDYYFGEYRLAE